MLPRPVIDACREIGKFYLKKHEGDYAKAEKELSDLRLTKIEIQGDKLCITAGRVGMLIGKRGTNVDALSKHIADTMFMKVHVIEDTDCLYDYIIPRQGDFD